MQIENDDYKRVLERFDDEGVFFYLDPPYYQTDAPLGLVWSEEEHKELAEVLKSLKGKWLLTYNDHKEIRKLYEGFKVERLVSHLRSPNVEEREGYDYWTQLIITNYDPEREAYWSRMTKGDGSN